MVKRTQPIQPEEQPATRAKYVLMDNGDVAVVGKLATGYGVVGFFSDINKCYYSVDGVGIELEDMQELVKYFEHWKSGV